MAEKIDSIRVDGTDYTFTLSSNSSLTISGLTVTGSITTDTIKADTANLAVIKITTSFPAGSSIPDRTVSIDTDGIFSSDNYEIEVVNEDSTITLSANKIKLTTQSNACDLIFDTGTGFSTPTILMSCNSNLLISTNSDSIFIDGNSLRSPSKGYIEIQDLVPIKSISSAYADFGTTSK